MIGFSWPFLEEVLRTVEFSIELRKLIMFCVSLASLSVLQSAEPLEDLNHHGE